jgi:uncharacterized protein with PQ loop repeat
MQIEFISVVADFMQLSVAGLSLVAYIPQWIKLVRSKSSRDISLKAWVLWTVSSVFAVIYALVQLYRYGIGWALLVSSLLSLGFVLVTVILIVHYRYKSPDPVSL